MFAGHKAHYLPGAAQAPGSPVSWSAAEEGRRLLQKANRELLVSLLGERSGHICILPSWHLLRFYMAKWHVILKAPCVMKALRWLSLHLFHCRMQYGFPYTKQLALRALQPPICMWLQHSARDLGHGTTSAHIRMLYTRFYGNLYLVVY